jgi:hypothetical protein
VKQNVSVVVFVIVLAACGGGGGGGGSLPGTVTTPPPAGGAGSPSPKPTPSAHATASPTPVPTATPTPLATPTPTPAPATLQITASLPLNEQANYLANPLVFGIRLLTVNGINENAVTTVPTTCTSTSCRLSLMVPPGSDTFAVTYAIGAGGSTNQNLAPLAYRHLSVAVQPKATTVASVTLFGIPAFYELDAVGTSPWIARMPLAQQFVDASNTCTPPQVVNGCALTTFIPGTFANVVTLTDTDTSGQTALSLNNGPANRTVTVTRDSDSVALVISASATITQAYITPSSAFSSAQFGRAYNAVMLRPWATQDPNGLGFTCVRGACQTTGPSSVTIQ